MTRQLCLFLIFGAILGLRAQAADIQPTDIFTATTRVDTRDWSTEPLALLFPYAVQSGEDELWVSDLEGDIWHIDMLNGAKTLLGSKETPSGTKNGINLITRVGEEIVVPFSLVSGSAEFSHIVIDLESGTRRGFKNADANTTDLIGLPNGNLLGTVFNGALVIFDVNGETLVKTAAPVFGEPIVRGFARHPDGRIIGIATASDLSGSLLVEIDPETAVLSTIATLAGILPTRIAVAPDGTYYAVQREDKDEFTLYKIDGQSFAVSEIPLPEFDFELNLFFDLDVASDGRVLIGIEDRRARRSFEIGYPVILGIDPDTFETEIVVGGWSPTMTTPGFAAMGQDNAIYITGNKGGEHRVLRQDLKTGGITVVTNSSFVGAVLNSTGALAVHGDDIYVINNAGSPEWEQLVQVDRVTGQQTMLGSFGARLMVQQMQVDPEDGSLLIAAWGATAESFRSILRVVPQANPTFQRVNASPLPGNPMAFDTAPDGSLVVYVTESEGSFLYRIEPDTGSFSRIGDRVLPPNYAGPLVVLDDGTIVARGFRDDRTRIVLETIDPVTGVATEVIDTPPHAVLLTRLPRGSGAPANLSAAAGANALGEGWFQSPWYGLFSEFDSWSYHSEHGWQFFGGSTSGTVQVFDSGLGTWIAIHPDTYPFIYARAPLDKWLFHVRGGNPGNRRFLEPAIGQ